MEPACVRQTSIPGTSKLFSDYLYDFDRVKGFYSSHFGDPEALCRSARQIDYPDGRRASVVAALRKQNGDSPALSKLARPGTVAVVTGQQVGLFSGPAYTVYKALTAVKLAKYLDEQGTSAVPVFWLATEDHDLAEVDHTWIFDADATPTKVSVTSTVTNGGPVGAVRFGDIPVSELRQALGTLPYAEEVIQRIAQFYRPGATFGSAFRSFLQDILKDLGLLYLDPLDSDIRAVATPLLTTAVDAIAELKCALRQRDSELVGAGYHAQVYIDEDSSLLFLLADGKRLPMRWKENRFVARDRSYSEAELRALGDRLSPNALLRPVMQDYLLPTAAYVGGPAEVAYLAQSQPLYQKLLGRMPVVFPRNSFTLVDTRVTKLLNRYGLHVHDLFDHHENVKSRMAAKLVPADLTNQFAELRSTASHSLEKLQANLAELDPTLDAAARKSRAKILYQLDRLTQKTARETMRRDQRASKDAAYLQNLIYPHRRLQERFYSIVPFLAKYGPDLPQRLLSQTQLACPDHMIRTIV